MKQHNFKIYSSFRDDFWYIISRQDLLYGIISKFFKDRIDLRILDAGCGTGFNFAALTKFGDVYGVDLSKDAVRQCKKYPYAKLELKDATKLDFDGYFDIVVAIELLEHIADDLSALKQFNKYLKPGGLLIATVPAHRLLWSTDDVLAMHKRRYSKNSFSELVNVANFKILYSGYRYFFYFLPSVLLFFFQKFKKDKNSLEYTPSIMNSLLTKIMRIENSLISHGFILPIGVGLICIAKKR